MKEILFKGKKYLSDIESLDEKGFIATKYQYQNGLCSYAHYYPDLGVLRFRDKIGRREDIKILKDVNVEPESHAFDTLLTSKSWPFNA